MPPAACLPVRGRRTMPRVSCWPVDQAKSQRNLLDAEVVVFSFVGVLGITLVLFLVVALTGRLILGR